jgi:hypothetical protein
MKTDMTLEKIHQLITSIEAKIDSLLEENASLKKQLSSTERRLENQIAWNFELRQILFGMGE